MASSSTSGSEPMVRVNATACGVEFLGTFLLVLMGTGAIIVDHLSGGAIGHLGICAAFGATVAVVIYGGGHISGGHYNPAVTLTLGALRLAPRMCVVPYIASQLAGALAASWLLRYCFGNVAMLGATVPTLPANECAYRVSFLVESLFTGCLMCVIVSAGMHVKAHGSFAGVAIGLTVFIGALLWGPVSGGSFNPARSLGPAVMSGTYRGLWIYMVAPVLGALVGGTAALAAKVATSEGGIQLPEGNV